MKPQPQPARQAVVVTSGDPAGVGPELCLDLLSQPTPAPVVVLADRDILAQRAEAIGATFAPDDFATKPNSPRAVWHCEADAPVVAGKPSPDNARHVVRQLNLAAEQCLAGRFRAMLTAPVSKAVIREANIPFVGITEHLAKAANIPRAVMLMASPAMRVALATTHIPLAEVPRAITRDSLRETLAVLNAELRAKFTNGRAPTIRVAGLNPHAGENGNCGREEIETIAPAIAEAKQNNIRAEGPFPADTLFTENCLLSSDCDCLLAMYHDQALPAFKAAHFHDGVNVTLGLPFVRVSPDHGVAADIAATGTVRPDSMRAALNMALAMTKNKTASETRNKTNAK